MRTIFLTVIVLFAFISCNDDNYSEDYNLLTTEELLASAGGLDYLVKTAAPIDYAYIDEQLKTKVFKEKTFYVLDKDGWTDSSKWYGTVTRVYYFCLDETTIRECRSCFYEFYVTPTGDVTQNYYIDRPFTGDRLTAMLNAFCFGSKLVAQIGDTLIVEKTDEYRRLWRYVVTLTDLRDRLLEEFPYSMDEISSDYPVPPQN